MDKDALPEVSVATVLTVYGIETTSKKERKIGVLIWLQQYLPFTVLKLLKVFSYLLLSELLVATVLTVYGIETFILS